MASQIHHDIIKEHLPYEIDMLRSTWRRLQQICSPPQGPETHEQQVERFSLIESFCVHGRSLTDFFDIRGKVKRDDVVSSDFTEQPTGSLDATKEPLKTLRRK